MRWFESRKVRRLLLMFAGLMLLACVFTVGHTYTVLAQTPIPWFTDDTAVAGLTNVIGRNISVADVNGDGYPDLLLHLPLNEATGDVLDKQFLYLNQPDTSGRRRYVDFTAASGIRANRQGTGLGRHSSFAIFADVDNDGKLDMFSGVYGHRLEVFPDRGDRNDLYMGDGQGHFTLSTASNFHTEPLWNTAGGVFFDYNKDGMIDLFIGNWYGAYSTLSESILYQGGGDGSFNNVNAATGLAGNRGAIYAVTAMDYNIDGYPDLLVPSYGHTMPGQQSVLWNNNRNGTFGMVQSAVRYAPFEGYPRPVSGFGSMPRDFNNDGWPDVLELLVHGDATNREGSKTTVLVNGYGTFYWNFNTLPRAGGTAADDLLDHYGSWFDFNNDGLPDLALSRCCNGGADGNQISLFQQMPDHTFVDVTQASGLGVINANPNLRPHNVTPLDYDQDGAEDLIVGFADGSQPVMLWHNNIGKLNNHISVRLHGSGPPTGSNTAAIGAKVEVMANGITQAQTIEAGNGQFGPQRPLDLVFGIGKATVVDRVRITWPNVRGSITDLTYEQPNQVLAIYEPPPPIVSLVGDKDNIHPGDSADSPYRSLRVVHMVGELSQIPGQNPGVDLDVGGYDRPVGWTHRFNLPANALITGATVVLRLMGNSPLVSNDELLYEQTPISHPFVGAVQYIPFIAARDGNGGNPPGQGIVGLVYDLAKTPVRINCPECVAGGDLNPLVTSGPNQNGEYRDLLGLLLDGEFDLTLGDDATVDYSQLTISFIMPGGKPGDLTGDRFVDSKDLDLIHRALNTSAYGPMDPRDLNHDGKINSSDADLLARMCSKPRCAAQ